MKFATSTLPGIGGSYKETPSDFIVEEMPLYPCCGSGEHLYLWVEKRGISTSELINRLARGLHLKDTDIGYAGLKDSRALTRQWLSIPAAKQPHMDRLRLNNIRILDIQRHTNKLRLGHLAGNRFSIRLQQLKPGAAELAEAILEHLCRHGVPNRFGEQRYGVLGNSAVLGHLLLRHDYAKFCRELLGDPEKISHPGWKKAAMAYREGKIDLAIKELPGAMHLEQRLLRDLLQGKTHEQAVYRLPKQRLRFFLSALQSRYFDQLLDARISALGELRDGDIACKHINGACFLVAEAEREQPRADSFEISPTAPLFGHKVMLAASMPGAAETALLERAELTLNSWKPAAGLAMPGERRPLRVPLEQPAIVSTTDAGLTLEFALPKGSYATSVLFELMKSSQA